MQRLVMLFLLVIALARCSREDAGSAKSAAESVSANHVRQSLRAAASTIPVTTTPPEYAKHVDGIYYIVLAPGFGKERPVLGNQNLLVTTYISYDERGVMKSEPHTTLQELDAAPAEWRAVLTDMVAGETRRIWIPEGREAKVYDVELQSFGKSPRRKS